MKKGMCKKYSKLSTSVALEAMKWKLKVLASHFKRDRRERNQNKTDNSTEPSKVYSQWEQYENIPIKAVEGAILEAHMGGGCNT